MAAKAQAAFDAGSFDEAARRYESLSRRYPDDNDAAYWLAVSRYQLKRYEEAMAGCEALLGRAPDDLRTLALKAEILLETGADTLGQEVLETAIRLHPKDVKSYRRLARLFRDKRQFDRALEVLRRAVRENDDAADAYADLYEIAQDEIGDAWFSYYYLKRFAETSAGSPGMSDVRYAIQRLEQQNPDYPDRYRETRQTERAARPGARGSEDAAEHRLMGELYLHADRPADALRELEEALRLDGDDLEARYLIGWAYLRTGAPAQARAAWERVLAADPGYRKAAVALKSAF
jgi:tetratricopeptide (TPR) repeat protein